MDTQHMIAVLAQAETRCDEVLKELPETEVWFGQAATSFNDSVYHMHGCITRARTAISNAKWGAASMVALAPAGVLP